MSNIKPNEASELSAEELKMVSGGMPDVVIPPEKGGQAQPTEDPYHLGDISKTITDKMPKNYYGQAGDYDPTLTYNPTPYENSAK
ncbi:hypothetical protein IQ250_29620 [Pseudanabaenaceae cyanobacterium LEGE 13415]|nr:hypothetical protein [Pseudanabaenaceae cyanobacterium LEGE 13415]